MYVQKRPGELWKMSDFVFGGGGGGGKKLPYTLKTAIIYYSVAKYLADL